MNFKLKFTNSCSRKLKQMSKTLYVITDQLFMHRVIKNNPVTIMLKHAKAVCC